MAKCYKVISEINLLKEVQNSNYLDAYKSLYKKLQKLSKKKSTRNISISTFPQFLSFFKMT